MSEKEDVQAGQKELTVEDLETVAGGLSDEDAAGVEIDETDGGNKGVKIS